MNNRLTIRAGVTMAVWSCALAGARLTFALAGEKGGNPQAAAADEGKRPVGDEKENEDAPDADSARAFLTKPAPKLAFDGVPLDDATAFLVDVFNVPIVLDRPALAAAKIDPGTPIS